MKDIRKIAVANLKGGSCKTTTTVSVAACIAETGRRVLIVDLDPQASASYWCGVTDTGGPELSDVLAGTATITDAVRATSTDGVYVLPGSKRTAGAERDLARETIGGETALRRALDSSTGEYDTILIDSPPTLGLLALNGLLAADALLIPVEARIMALTGLVELTDTVGKIRSRTGHNLDIIGIVVCRVDGRARHPQEVAAAVKATYGPTVFNTEIRESIRIAEAPGHGKPITVYDPHGHGAEDYRSLTHELILRLQNGKNS